MTAFLYSCTLGNISVSKYLMENGCNIFISDMYDTTALHIAVQKGLLSLVRLLLSEGMDIYAVDASGNDVFYYAEKSNNSQIKELLETRKDEW